MGTLLFLWLMAIYWPSLISSKDVICSLNEYIVTGVEFSQCQKETLASFSHHKGNSGETEHHCKELKHIVENCATIVEVSTTFLKYSV